MMANRTFHLFSELPPEIRARIWRHTVEPRIVPVTCWVGNKRAEQVSLAVSGDVWEKALADYRQGAQTNASMKTKLPLELYARSPLKPAVLDACRESRGLGLYEKMILTPGSSASYAWVNYDVDIIYLKDHDEPYTRLRNCGSRVRRLKIKVDVTDEFWDRNRSSGLKFTFSQLKECFVVMRGEGRIWFWRTKDNHNYISCPFEKIHLIEERTNEQMTLAELCQLSEEQVMSWVRSTDIEDDSSEEDDSE